jgi:hypothetical protein
MDEFAVNSKLEKKELNQENGSLTMREKNILTIKMYQIWTRIGSSKDSMTIRLSFNIPNKNLSFSISNYEEH